MTTQSSTKTGCQRLAASAIVALLVGLATGCGEKTPDTVLESDNDVSIQWSSHERMSRMLAEIAVRSKDENPFVGDAHARRLRAFLSAPGYLVALSPTRQWELHFELGRAELELGNEVLAIELLNQAMKLIPASKSALVKKTHFELGIASLRYGETQSSMRNNKKELLNKKRNRLIENGLLE